MQDQTHVAGQGGDPLAAATIRFAHWRQRSPGRPRIPADLWMLAANLAADHGVSKVANRLKLDYYTLKRRLEERGRPTLDGATAPESAFVELDLGDARATSDCVLELADDQGRSLRIEIASAATADVADLAGRLWQTCR